ncbi:restriction endonuclease [Salipaludibacillus neizhouensis]|uniref:Restriction endonuclease n=1 Tax=Salipaludibacillus neizhouensis TaxID=885475 RepID=A0A3A9K9I0_9BACI|nr:restriction endonuclease [Salipaludibacillus neizhouensis]RKL69157.1 restriction endonuclease [Salipaludibacillus neizhouensis]
MENNKLISKTKMSELVGWSESNGRRWVKHFKDYIPSEVNRNKVMYTMESLRIMKFLKKINEAGLTTSEIKLLLNKEGMPKNEQEEQRIIEKHKIDRAYKDYDENVKGTIPSVGEMMIPYLELIKDGEPYSASEITEKLVDFFKLTEIQRLMKYENNSDIIFLSKVRSVRYSLKKENYIEEVNKLTYQITSDGLELLNESKGEIDEEVGELEKVVDPLTIVKENLDELKNELADNLLKQLRSVHWMKFEDIVVELLTVMGYGDGEVTQRTNDEGLDGVIKEDKLGLDNIYVQAKSYAANNSVGRDVVQSFSGALDGKGARKGVFITTSYFTQNARKYAERLDAKKIILIDGIELSKLMINHSVGVDINHTFVVKAIDYDYFKDE